MVLLSNFCGKADRDLTLDKLDLERIQLEVEKENSPFARKVSLDTLTIPPAVVGREDKARELVRFLAGYRQGLVVPFISVYGRSGSGKSTVVKYVCKNLDWISHRFVNLRPGRTVFGCANMILGELGGQGLRSRQGINLAIEKIGDAIEALLRSENGKLFVLVLDEFDILFHDRRSRPSDFIYALLMMEERLRERQFQMTIIAISNSIMATNELDDRVKSRIGSSEVHFDAYSKNDVLAILNDRAKAAFSKPLDPAVIEYCADQSSLEHGDARRAVDLLRVAAEIAGSAGEEMASRHVDMAAKQLQSDRIRLMLSSASYHFRLVSGALARITYLTGETWHPTSVIFDDYTRIVQDGTIPLKYRRVSELLVELEETGIAISQTRSQGRHGYGTQYKLAFPPEAVGHALSEEWWDAFVSKRKSTYDTRDRVTGRFF